jgi:hypothetical protein
MPNRSTRIKSQTQIQSFKEAARSLECDESEETFDKALGKMGRSKPVPPKKRPAKPS